MKVVILAGGFGTRLSEETAIRPKPMVEIGGQPILWHIMSMYARHGLTDFIVCLGHLGHVVKAYFANYRLHHTDLAVDLASGRLEPLGDTVPDWKVALIDTGTQTMTGGRLRRVANHLPAGETFCMTYGDGVSDVDITALLAHHRASGLEATLTAVRPIGRFGATEIEGRRVTQFTEKPAGDGGWVSGGFFVLERRVIDRIAGDDTTWERDPLEGLAADGQLGAYQHEGFWQPMDTPRDKACLEGLWREGRAPWRTW